MDFPATNSRRALQYIPLVNKSNERMFGSNEKYYTCWVVAGLVVPRIAAPKKIGVFTCDPCWVARHLLFKVAFTMRKMCSPSDRGKLNFSFNKGASACVEKKRQKERATSVRARLLDAHHHHMRILLLRLTRDSCCVRFQLYEEPRKGEPERRNLSFSPGSP